MHVHSSCVLSLLSFDCLPHLSRCVHERETSQLHVSRLHLSRSTEHYVLCRDNWPLVLRSDNHGCFSSIHQRRIMLKWDGLMREWLLLGIRLDAFRIWWFNRCCEERVFIYVCVWIFIYMYNGVTYMHDETEGEQRERSWNDEQYKCSITAYKDKRHCFVSAWKEQQSKTDG